MIKIKDNIDLKELEKFGLEFSKVCEEYEQRLAIYKRALELENEERFKNIDSIWMIEGNNRTKFINTAEELTNYFLDQAKKEQEKGEKK